MKNAMLTIVLFCISAVSYSQEITIGVPVLENQILQQVSSVYVNAGEGTNYYWLYSSPAEGSMFLVARGYDQMPVLNDNNQAWQHVSWESFFDDLAWNYGEPQAIEQRAWLTDAMAYTIWGDFAWSYDYFCWDDDFAELQAESVLYSH